MAIGIELVRQALVFVVRITQIQSVKGILGREIWLAPMLM